MSLPQPEPRRRHYPARLSTPGRPSRRAGTVRFDAYFKVQVWQPNSLAWKDIQRAYDTADEAWAACPAGQECRLMRVYPGGREPITR